MNKYKCYNCENFYSINIKDIIRHCRLKKKCERTENSLLYSTDQVLLLTLFINNSFNKQDIEKFKNSCILYDNREKIFDLVNKINITKDKKCMLCNKEFKKKMDIRYHLLFECFEKNINKDSKKNESVIIDSTINIGNSVVDNSITDNSTTNVTINNINHINNINIELKYPVSFNNNWDTSHIDFNTINSILISNHLITTYLTEVLKNDNNLNVILNNNDTEGLVFDEKKYVKMKKEDITDKTMDKINNDLNNFLNDNKRKKEVVSEFLHSIKKILEKKIIDFKEDKNGIKQVVVNFISQIYETKRESAIEACNKNSLSIPIDGF